MKTLSLSFISLIILILFGSFFAHTANAATLTGVKDTITTSRPSAASPVTANAASGVGQVSIANNGSRFIASDSAKVMRTSTGGVVTTGLIVASQSADLDTVYFGGVTGTAIQNGTDVLIVPVTARHTISFQLVQTVPIGGTIVVTFPGSANNTASPSASTFAFNNLAAANVTFSGSGCATGALTISSPTISCTTTAAYTAGTTVTITVGSSTPALINPTVSSSGVCITSPTYTCTADTWKVQIDTTDGTDPLDTGSTRIATIDSVQVQATVEPTITFTISGIPNGTNINSNGTWGVSSCGSYSTNSGIDATATSVNLGILANGYVSFAAQQLSVSTNAATGYAITATSSGQLKNPATGAIILDANGGTGLTADNTPAPAAIAAGTPAFGIHPCGARSNIGSDIWVNNGTATTSRFLNPWNTGTNSYVAQLASYTGGAVTADKTNVVYGSTVAATTPAGIYQTTLTYVATATF